MSGLTDPTAPFLGVGWSFPPSFGPGGGNVAMAAGEQDIQQSLQIIVCTELGERAMRGSFGCSLRRFAFELVDNTLLTSISSAVSDAILYNEPRVRLDAVSTSERADAPGLVEISVAFTVRATNTRFNMVYPYYLVEATALGR